MGFSDSLIFKKVGFHLLIYYLHPRNLSSLRGLMGTFQQNLSIGSEGPQETEKREGGICKKATSSCSRGGGQENRDLHSTGGKKQIKDVGSLCAHNYKYESHWT